MLYGFHVGVVFIVYLFGLVVALVSVRVRPFHKEGRMCVCYDVRNVYS